MTQQDKFEAAADLRKLEFAFPGPLRDRLVAAVLDGTKTSTTGLLQDYENGNESVPALGDRFAVIDSAGDVVAVVEMTEVRLLPLGDVDVAHVRDEGEGHETVAQWRSDHQAFWHSDEMKAELGDPTFAVDDTTTVVLERYEVVIRRLP